MAQHVQLLARNNHAAAKGIVWDTEMYLKLSLVMCKYANKCKRG